MNKLQVPPGTYTPQGGTELSADFHYRLPGSVPYRIFSYFFKNMVKIANDKYAAVSFFAQYSQKSYPRNLYFKIWSTILRRK